MMTLAIILIFCFPALVILKNISRVADLKLELEHSRILYAFCSVRDTFALKAIRNEVSEESELFKFFYGVNSMLIHDHPKHGKCFVEMIREIYKKRTSNNKAPQNTRLAKELGEADKESKAAAMLFIHAYSRALLKAMPLVIVDAFAKLTKQKSDGLILKIVALNPFSTDNRNAAQFGMALARAACL